jgi:hypothetical protein
MRRVRTIGCSISTLRLPAQADAPVLAAADWVALAD